MKMLLGVFAVNHVIMEHVFDIFRAPGLNLSMAANPALAIEQGKWVATRFPAQVKLISAFRLLCLTLKSSMQFAVNGNFSPWSEWSNCSRDCGVGTRQRSRTCTNPQPMYKGFPCFGSKVETASCGDPDGKCCSLGCCSG